MGTATLLAGRASVWGGALAALALCGCSAVTDFGRYRFDGGAEPDASGEDASARDGGSPMDAPPSDGGLATDTAPESDVAPPDGPDAAPPCAPTTELDLLLVIDDSGSMSQEQALLRAELPALLSALAPRASLHVGVISTDMGAGDVPPGETVPTCDPGLGDDGILRNVSTGSGAGCMASYPARIFAFSSRTADVTAFARDVACVADLGTAGCGFEQQLEAALKALSPAARSAAVAPSYTPPAFFGGTPGHGDGLHDGFLRNDSALAILLLTDEEDCSVPDYRIFYPSDPAYAATPLNLRCFRFDGRLHPVSRYVEGLLQLRARPERLVFLPVVGVPSDLVGASYETILADPRMQYVEDGSATPPSRLLPSCESSNGLAFPPRRIVEVARGLRDGGARSAVVSICETSGAGWRTTLVNEVDGALSCAAP